MSPFHFRLEKVLAWRRTQLEVENAKLQRQIAAVAELDRDRAELQATALRSAVQVRDWRPLAGQDLAALSSFHVHLQNRGKDIATRRSEASRQLAAQQQALLEARRRCRLLERLEQQRRAEWQAAADREVEQLAAESYLSGMARRGAGIVRDGAGLVRRKS